jgi:hypothetical protein
LELALLGVLGEGVAGYCVQFLVVLFLDVLELGKVVVQDYFCRVVEVDAG